MSKKKTKKSTQHLIYNDDDYIYCPRLGNSLAKLIELNPDGVDNERIAKVLMMEEQEVEDIFESAIKKIRKIMKIDGKL